MIESRQREEAPPTSGLSMPSSGAEGTRPEGTGVKALLRVVYCLIIVVRSCAAGEVSFESLLQVLGSAQLLTRELVVALRRRRRH